MTDHDAGIDADGITRNIARTINHVEILEGKPIPHDWSWVCKSLWKKGADDGCALNMLDSVFTNASQPQAWFFTNRDGTVSKKSTKHLTLQRIAQQFSRIALSYPENSARLSGGKVSSCSFTPVVAAS